ncbi:hypothetical protein [Salibacterium sp. K-3]
MAEKKSGLIKLFSKSSSKDCCSVEIEEVKSSEKSSNPATEKNSTGKRKEE